MRWVEIDDRLYLFEDDRGSHGTCRGWIFEHMGEFIATEYITGERERFSTQEDAMMHLVTLASAKR